MSQSTYWWGYDLANVRDYNRCLKQLIKMCRTSIEYDEWQKMTKRFAEDTCPLCGIDFMYGRAEAHHYPKTIYEIIEEHVQDLIHTDKLDDVNPLDLVREIMQEHLQNRIDHIVLCEYCHKRYHAQDVDIINQLEKYWNAIQKEKQNG